MTEEQVTKALLNFLIKDNWEILAYDFPQSGTGKAFHLNNSKAKNKGVIIPDIIASKSKKAIFFENKDKLVIKDFEKQKIFLSGDYSISLQDFCIKHTILEMYCGIGIPYNPKDDYKINQNLDLVDFLLRIEDNRIIIEYDKFNLFF